MLERLPAGFFAVVAGQHLVSIAGPDVRYEAATPAGLAHACHRADHAGWGGDRSLASADLVAGSEGVRHELRPRALGRQYRDGARLTVVA